MLFPLNYIYFLFPNSQLKAEYLTFKRIIKEIKKFKGK